MPITIFFCYAREDEVLLEKLKDHLRPLQRENLIDFWYDRKISPGADWEKEINQRLNTAQIILLLVSSDFMSSDYCYGIEMKRALERHNHGNARVIPIILRPTYWRGTLSMLQALPSDGTPITDPKWYSQDRAFYDVVEGISQVVHQLQEENSQESVKQRKVVRSRSLLNPSNSMQKRQLSLEDQNQQTDDFANLFAVPASHQTTPNTSQMIKRQEKDSEDEQWMELRWFIFALGILSLLFSMFIFFFQTSTVISIAICLALACVILGLLQSAHLNQWYWFGFLLLLGPLGGIIYAWLHPSTKQSQSSPPRQLIMIILWFGFIGLGVALILQLQSADVFTKIYLGICGDFLLAGTLLTLIRAIKLKHLSMDDSAIMIFFLIAPLIALIYIMSPSSKEE